MIYLCRDISSLLYSWISNLNCSSSSKKFDLRIYVLIKSFDPIEAYICDEGLARFCTQDYKLPTKDNMRNLFMHLTNFSLNKNSEHYKAPDEDFMQDDTGSKRLLSSLYKQLQEEGHDV